MSQVQFSEEINDILCELFNTGIGHAANAMSELLQQEILLSIPQLHTLMFNELKLELSSLFSDKYVVVLQEFSGELKGTGLVTFPVNKGKTLVNLLMDDINYEGVFDVLELEAISEVGNLIINAVAGIISDMSGIETHYELPKVFITSNILDCFKDKNPTSVFLIGRIQFSVKDQNIQGQIFFIYEYNNIELIVKRIEEKNK